MKIRDSHAKLIGDDTVLKINSDSIDILADDGLTLFGITLNKDGTLRIDAGSTCKHRGKILYDRIRIIPIASNCFTLEKPEYK